MQAWNRAGPGWRAALAAAAAVASLAGCRAAVERSGPPDVVLVVVDTLRADHLPSYGYPIDTAPTLERLAQRGVLFERVIAPSSWTKTSVASIVTARNPANHRVLRHRDALPRQLTTLAEAFAAHGYTTLGVNTNPWLQPQFGFGAGFHRYETLRNAKVSGRAGEVATKALELLRARPPGVPAFLYLHFMDVHGPYRPDPGFVAGEPVTLAGRGVVPDAVLEEEYRKPGLAGPGVRERVVAMYDGGIRSFDAAFDHFLTELSGVLDLDHTLLVVTADHGEAFGEHGTTEHGWNLYPEVVEVPLLFVWPAQLPQAVRISAQVRSIDIAPTLLTLAGVPLPASFEGTPLLPMEPGAITDRLAHSEVYFRRPRPPYHRIAVISRDHLYQRETFTDVSEFFDLRSDPAAQNDLGGDHPDAAAYAARELSVNVPPPPERALDSETRKELEALGYLH